MQPNDLEKKFRNLLSVIGGGVNSVTQYFNPESNKGQNFWSSPAAQPLAQVQQTYQRYTPQPVQKFHSGFTSANTLGLVDMRVPKQGVVDPLYSAGWVAGAVNPFNPINKLGIMQKAGTLGSTAVKNALSRIAPRIAASTIAKSFLPAVGSELAQSAAYVPASYFAGQAGLKNKTELSPQALAQDALMGLGFRGAFNTVGKMVKPMAQGMAKNQYKYIDAKDKNLILNTIEKMVTKGKNADYWISGSKDRDTENLRQLGEYYIGKNAVKNMSNQNIAQHLLNRLREEENSKPFSLPDMGVGFVGKQDIDTSKVKQTLDLLMPQPDQMRRQAGSYSNVRSADNPLFGGNIVNKPPYIKTDKATQSMAEFQAGRYDDSGRPSKSTVDAFQRWVNSQKASFIEGAMKKRDFKDLDEKGLGGFFEFQAGNHTGRYRDVKEFFDKKFDILNKSGVEVEYKKDYLPQLWANKQEEIDKAFGKGLGLKPSFTLESIIENYKQGLAAGLTPKFKTIKDLVGYYEQKANKAIADREYFDDLTKNGLALPSNKAPQDWVTLDPDRFPKYRVSTADGDYQGTYKAPKELADMINTYLQGARVKSLQQIADYVSGVKNKVLNFGIPFTGVNAHGLNILTRNTLAAKNPVMEFLRAANYMVNPKAAENYLDANLKDTPDAVRHGLTFGIEDHKVLTEDPGFKTRFGETWSTLFEKPLFDKMLPALKLNYYKQLRDEYSKSMTIDDAGREAAKVANTIYGGYNWEQLGKSTDFQNLKRIIFLAPDWLGTNVELGRRIPESLVRFNDPKLKAYRRFATNLIGAYVLANVVNKFTSGKWMHENDPGHTFEVEAGYTEDGQKRYVRPFGTAIDFVRIPIDVAIGLSKGDPSAAFRAIRNRLSIPAGSALGLLSNTDYRGNAIYGRDKYGNELSPSQSALGIAGEAANFVGIPSFLKQGLDFTSGKTGGEQAALQAFELPFRYSGSSNSALQKQVKTTTKQEGITGKDLYDLNHSLRGERKLSEQQLLHVGEEGIDGLREILEMREMNRAFKKDGTAYNTDVNQTYASEGDNFTKSSVYKEKLARFRAKSTGKVQEDDDTYFYYENKKTQSVPKSFSIPELDLTGDEGLDKELIQEYMKRLVVESKNVLERYKIGKITREQAIEQLKQIKSEQEVLKTPQSAIRPRVGRKHAINIPRISSPRVAFTQAPKRKLTTVRIVKAPRVKKRKSRSLKDLAMKRDFFT